MAIPSITGGRRKRVLALLVGNGLAQAATLLSTTVLIQVAFDRLVATPDGADVQTAVWICGGLAAVAGATVWLKVRARIDSERLGQDYVHKVRMKMFEHLMELSPEQIKQRRRGTLILRFVGDLTALKRWVSEGLERLLVVCLMTLAGLAALSWVSFDLAVTVGVIFAGAIVIATAQGKSFSQALKETRRRRGSLAANITEKITSISVIQACAQNIRERRRFNRQGKRLREAMIRNARLTARMRGVTEGAAAVALAAVLFLGGREVVSGRATPGMVVAAMAIVRLIMPLLRDIGRLIAYWHAYQVSRQKIEEFLTIPAVPAQATPRKIILGGGKLEFRGVKVEGRLFDFSVTAAAGSKVAIIGPSGAGKSTVLLLVARLIDPHEGTILLDDYDIRHWSLQDIRKTVGFVSADLPLLRGSIEKNIRYRHPEASPAEVERVIRLCDLDEIFSALPEGRRTRVSEGGLRLSAGQRWRLALARAVLGNSLILVLDDMDGALDLQSSAVVERITREYNGTVLMVSRSENIQCHADAVWRLESGRLVEVTSPSNGRQHHAEVSSRPAELPPRGFDQ